jgi:drug/metabolite transporter (DMT)-like permease
MSSLSWRRWLPEFVLLAALWGSSFLFMREAVHGFGPFATAWGRVTLAALLLTPLLWWRNETTALRRHWRPLLVMGLLSAGIPFACYAYALLSISTGLSSILNATTPLFGALIAWLWLNERLRGPQLVGLGLGFAGVVALASEAPGGISMRSGGSGLAVAACLLATFCYGLAGSFNKRHLHGLSALAITTGSLWGASIGLLLPALWLWPTSPPQPHAWFALGAAGVLCTAVAYVLYFRLMALTGPARTMTVTYLIPVFANLLGVLALGEVVSAWMLGCGAVILLGTALSAGLLNIPPARC